MSRDITKIMQVPSPTDGSLRKFVEHLLKERTVTRATIKIGILAAVEVEAVREAVEADENGEGAVQARTASVVESEVANAFGSTTATSSSAQKVTFYKDAVEVCAFERVRTTAHFIPNQRTVQYYGVPDYRVAEFFFPRSMGQEGEAFTSALSQYLRPTIGEVATEAPDGLATVLERMTSVSAGMMEDLAKSQLAQEARMTALMEKQTEELKAQKAELDAAHKMQVEALEKRSAALDDREDELDNATARSTRRKLRGAITDALKENQKQEIIPESARKVRTPIYIIAGLGIVTPLLFSGWAFLQVANIPAGLTGAALNWYLASLLLRGSLGIAAAVAVGLYLLRYLRNIEAEAGRRALALEQNLFDIDRASWVVETVMELKDEEGMTSVPGPWLEGVTRGLFQHHGEESEERGPVDALIGLMGSGMALKLNSGGSEVSFDSKAAKAIARKQKKEGET